MALMTARRLVVRGRPPGRAAGRSGATSAQASSVKSVSYNSSVFSTDQLYTDSGKLFKHPLRALPSGNASARKWLSVVAWARAPQDTCSPVFKNGLGSDTDKALTFIILLIVGHQATLRRSILPE